jgi:hypothetical protein
MFGKWRRHTVVTKHIRTQDFGWKTRKPRCVGENNIIKDLKETGCEDVDRIYLAQVT